MTHYQKIATLIFRIIGLIVFLGGLLSMAVAWMLSLPAMNPFLIVIVYLPHLVGSIILFAASKFLAKLVCFGLGNSDEQK